MAYCSCCGFEKDTIYSECDNCGYPPRLAKTDDESEKKKREDFSQWEEYDPEWLVELAGANGWNLAAVETCMGMGC